MADAFCVEPRFGRNSPHCSEAMALSAAIQARLGIAGVNNAMPGWTIIERANLRSGCHGPTAFDEGSWLACLWLWPRVT